MAQIQTKNFVTKDGKKISIRNVTVDDAQGVLRLYNEIESIYEFRTSDKIESYITLEKEIEYMKKLYDEAGSLGLVAIFENNVIGFLDFNKKQRKKLAHVGSFGMSVHQNFVNKGIGRVLLSTLIEWAKAHPQIEKISLGVFSGNTPAIALYKKLGFIEEGCLKKDIKLSSAEYLDNLQMYLWVK